MIPASLLHVSIRLRRLALALGMCLAGLAPLTAEPVKIKPGATFPELATGSVTYRKVTVKSISARTVMILHAGGLASVKLRDLSPELQAGFGYDPQAEAASDQAQQKAVAERQAREAAARRAAGEEPVRTGSKFDRILQDFGRPAQLQPKVDLRPRFRELELYAKDQGRRPSCAVFAVVSALEFLRAEETGKAEKLSEEYLIWATGKSMHRLTPVATTVDDQEGDADAGFALTEVVTALRSYGIPLQSTMPNTIGRMRNVTAEPSPAIIREARERTRVGVHIIPGRDNATQLNNIVHALNAGVPVAIGCGWPRFFNMRAALLNSQDPIPGYGHAVTLVGYTCETGRLEDTTFIFKNSWGAAWGANGYGFATYAYLAKNFGNGVLLELME